MFQWTHITFISHSRVKFAHHNHKTQHCNTNLPKLIYLLSLQQITCRIIFTQETTNKSTVKWLVTITKHLGITRTHDCLRVKLRRHTRNTAQNYVTPITDKNSLKTQGITWTIIACSTIFFLDNPRNWGVSNEGTKVELLLAMKGECHCHLCPPSKTRFSLVYNFCITSESGRYYALPVWTNRMRMT